ncbi:Peptidase T [uncultured Clostridium sp.]|nr:Peptidase T [uncultured Clostridium sp.]
MQAALERFLKYVTYDTASAYEAQDYPSTEKQKDFARMLAQECRQLGLSDVKVDGYGYLTATLPATPGCERAPTIGFLAHMDTGPDLSGADVRPRVVENYDGGDIPLDPEQGIVLSPGRYPSLTAYVGQTLVVTDGNTLLGADDKAGIAAIMEAMAHLLAHPEIAHGKIRIGFTPDEEVGNGVKYFDAKGFGVDFGYTLDGGALGEFEYENFNAAQAKVSVKGVSSHPGSAKDVMVNAALIAAEYAMALPQGETPANTQGYEGFYHLREQSGTVERAQLIYILRDFEWEGLQRRKEVMLEVAKQLNARYGEDTVAVELQDQYANMAQRLEEHPQVKHLALEAMAQLDITPVIMPIRGGTDGAVLSTRPDGFPCPNLFTGGHNAHGRYEYLVAESLEMATQVICRIAFLAAQAD